MPLTGLLLSSVLHPILTFRGLIARHSFEAGDLAMCVRPAALVQGEADEQPDPEFLVPALLEAARQPHVMTALSGLYDGTGVLSLHTSVFMRFVCVLSASKSGSLLGFTHCM